MGKDIEKDVSNLIKNRRRLEVIRLLTVLLAILSLVGFQLNWIDLICELLGIIACCFGLYSLNLEKDVNK